MGDLNDVRLERDGQVSLAFRGEPIASVTSAEPGKARWTELTLFRTEAGAWVLERRGCSDVPGERTFCSAVLCVSPQAVVVALTKSDGASNRYLPDVALDLLELAAEADPRLEVVAVERA